MIKDFFGLFTGATQRKHKLRIFAAISAALFGGTVLGVIISMLRTPESSTEVTEAVDSDGVYKKKRKTSDY